MRTPTPTYITELCFLLAKNICRGQGEYLRIEAWLDCSCPACLCNTLELEDDTGFLQGQDITLHFWLCSQTLTKNNGK